MVTGHWVRGGSPFCYCVFPWVESERKKQLPCPINLLVWLNVIRLIFCCVLIVYIHTIQTEDTRFIDDSTVNSTVTSPVDTRHQGSRCMVQQLKGGTLPVAAAVFPKGTRRIKGTKRRITAFLASVSCCHCNSISLPTTQVSQPTPLNHTITKETHIRAHLHTCTNSYPKEWLTVYPTHSPPGEQWLRVRGAKKNGEEKDRTRHSEVKCEQRRVSSAVTMSSLAFSAWRRQKANRTSA